MKTKLILLAAMLCALAITSPAQNNKTDKSKKTDGKTDRAMVEQFLIQAEKTAWRLLVEKKYDDFGKMLASDFKGVHSDHIVNKEEELAEVKKMNFKSAEVSDVKVQWIDDHAAIITATVKAEIVMTDGKPMNITARTTSIVAMRGNEWLCIYQTETEAHNMEGKSE